MTSILLHQNFNFVIALVLGVSTAFTILLLLLPSSYSPSQEDFIDDHAPPDAAADGQQHRRRQVKAKTSVQVVVLGDIGRSPRMQYHAISIAKHGGRVDLVGYTDSDFHPEIQGNSRINIIPIAPPPGFLRTSNRVLFLIIGPLKVLWQVWSLYYALAYRSRPSQWMLVQNPPSIPTLAIASMICFLRNTKLVIDWHNFGYSILALRLSSSHPLVRISEIYESAFSRLATSHLAVTNSMCRTLAVEHNVSASPLHDRPAPIFQPLTSTERSDFLSRLSETAQYAQDIQKGTWKLVVSSTSWTPDEDFSILLDALVSYSAAATRDFRLPRVLAIITGKGPQKEYYLSKINALCQAKQLQNVVVQTAWLSTADYALLLGAADLGVSLHTSSSGVDLPMKVVDMFGTGLPVLGWSDFEAWSELVKEDFNGRGFTSAKQLSEQLAELFGDDGSLLKRLRDGAEKECTHRWDDEWDIVAGKMFGLVN
ncbi:beta-1,4-mannosyltransferase [Pseudovirgaria hyperparasitica]|uniref:Chitobiosyldiphosphodolichol beta-mannosyltransferase n=1 Tax=Pseudovirgaria hyperparasitica TaxID=470096 RepID=A0A6A6WFT0_9PEZI|nr:beta-1,4-mannosyltransferase [Pseudovirgaria hyperparasitica]KAF2759991.1 beta-1,4-mannosyltransferase [Pseudovirgaria hyperparasitica]